MWQGQLEVLLERRKGSAGEGGPLVGRRALLAPGEVASGGRWGRAEQARLGRVTW